MRVGACRARSVQEMQRSMVVSGPEVLGLLVLGLGAGLLGAVVGIGGGVVIVPALLLVFGFDPRIAVATSLLAVIATSVAAGNVQLGSGLQNLRIGLSLELATIPGGIAGGLIATALSPDVISALLGVVVGVIAVLLLVGRDPHGTTEPGIDAAVEDRQAVGRLAGAYVDGHSGRLIAYEAQRVPAGSAVAFGAGALSGMLGVGGGFLKVPAMNLVMRLPLKVSAATSSVMVGITALASLSVYVAHGYLYPYAAAPVVLGVLIGAVAGAGLQDRSSPRVIRWVLAVVLAGIAVQLLLRAAGG